MIWPYRLENYNILLLKKDFKIFLNSNLKVKFDFLLYFLRWFFFYTLRCDKPSRIPWHSWYQLKAFGEKRCINFVSWHLDFKCENFEFQRF